MFGVLSHIGSLHYYLNGKQLVYQTPIESPCLLICAGLYAKYMVTSESVCSFQG